MARSQSKTVYRVIYAHLDKVHEIYCRSVGQADLYGFIEIEQMLFGERSQLVVDPGEEKLKNAFSGVQRSYIPLHHVLRIDEVAQEGISKISDHKGPAGVTPFPGGSRPDRS